VAKFLQDVNSIQAEHDVLPNEMHRQSSSLWTLPLLMRTASVS